MTRCCSCTAARPRKSATRWCGAFAQMQAAAGLRDSSDGMGYQGTWPTMLPCFLRIPIDQVLVGGGIGVRDRRVGMDIGSDHLPVLADPSHAGGRRDLVGPLSYAAIAAGADGLIIEVHPEPESATSDGDQSLDFDEFASLMRTLLPFVAAAGRTLAG